MQLYCPNCGAQVPARNINIHKQSAVCPDCDHLFLFDAAEMIRKSRRRPLVAPPSVHLQQREGCLSLAFEWRDERTARYIAFSVAWNVLVIAVTNTLIFEGFVPSDFLLLALPIFIGVSMTYYSAALLVNSTHIHVDAHTLSIRHLPLRMPGNLDVPRSSIRQVLILESAAENRTAGQTYDLVLALHNRTNLTALRGLQGELAFYLEHQLQALLAPEGVQP